MTGFCGRCFSSLPPLAAWPFFSCLTGFTVFFDETLLTGAVCRLTAGAATERRAGALFGADLCGADFWAGLLAARFCGAGRRECPGAECDAADLAAGAFTARLAEARAARGFSLLAAALAFALRIARTSASRFMSCQPLTPRALAIWPRSFRFKVFREAAVIKGLSTRLASGEAAAAPALRLTIWSAFPDAARIERTRARLLSRLSTERGGAPEGPMRRCFGGALPTLEGRRRPKIKGPLREKNFP